MCSWKNNSPCSGVLGGWRNTSLLQRLKSSINIPLCIMALQMVEQKTSSAYKEISVPILPQVNNNDTNHCYPFIMLLTELTVRSYVFSVL